MKAVGYAAVGPIDRPDALIDFEAPDPRPGPRDLLVRVQAISVNPVDAKIRSRRAPEGGAPAILGWDAVGEVVETGAEATLFRPGDQVWYAGAIDRPGANSELHVVDERIVGRKPESVSNAAAAALPLTTLTAHEMLFDRLRVGDPAPGAARALLLIGAAGGVGSITIQLARALSDLDVIATASRPETQAWARDLGAQHVIDHSAPLPAQVAALGLDAPPPYVFSTNRTELYVDQIAEVIAPQGRFGLIDDPESVDIKPFKAKSVSIHWELMYTRSLFQTPDMARQGEILNEAAALIDAGRIVTTATASMGAISAENLTRAHALIESGTAKGKLVLEGF
ncbi:MAG: zinc-binding alcohol dehydrogenase family protein [Pseudomonadota bacterium]